MLARSKTLPISINAAFVNRPLQDAVSEALLQVSRAREVVLSSGIVQRLVLPLRDRPAQVLETLSLSQAVLSCAMPDDLFAGETPRLTSLTLKRTELRWSSALLRPALRHLEIWDVSKDSLPTMNQVLDMLETMHDLQTLILVRALPGGTDVDNVQTRPGGFTFEDERVITLPALRKLHLGGEMSQCTTLMAHLSIPPDAQVELECTPSPDFPDLPPPVSTLEAVLASHFSRRNQYRNSRIPTFQSLSLGVTSSDMAYFHADTTTPLEDNGHAFSVTFQSASDVAGTSNAKLLLSSLCRVVILKDVRSLEVEGAAFTEGDIWRNFFGSMKDVERLFVAGAAADGFLHSLAYISPPPPHTTENPPTDAVLALSQPDAEPILGLLAQLKQVELVEVDLRTGVASRLCAGLRTMQDVSGLETLVLRSCEISQPDVDGLRRIGLEIDVRIV